MTDRLLQNTTATIAMQFAVGSTDTDPSPDTAVVTITRDGTAVVADVAATNAGTGEFSYTLTPAQTAVLGTLTAVWTLTYASQTQVVTTTHEIVGGFYYSLGEFRARYPELTAAAGYTDEKLAQYRALAEDYLERVIGAAFVPRATTESLQRTTSGDVDVKKWPARSVLALSVNGAAETAANYGLLNQQTIYPVVPFTAASATGISTVSVTYAHGYDAPPANIREAAMVLAKSLMVQGPIDDRASSIGTADGIITLATPGVRGSVTGIPFVDSVIAQERIPTIA